MTVEISRRKLLALGATLPLIGQFGSDVVQAIGRPEAVAAPAGSTTFVSVAPARLSDTRPDQAAYGGFTQINANTIRVQVAGRAGVPANATVAVLNVTAINGFLPGYVTVFPSGNAVPLASSLNLDQFGQIIANLVTVRLGTGGAVDLFCQNPVNTVVDVNGAYVPTAQAVKEGRFVALANATRVLDTRNNGAKVALGGVQRVSLAPAGVPPSAKAVVVNLTVTESNAAGYWTGYGAGTTRPASSSLNTDAAGQTRANQAILPIGSVGGLSGIDVFSSSGGHLIVDVAGYFTGASDLESTAGLFVPNAPYRALDTRDVPQYGRMYPGWICEFDFFGRSSSQAVCVNLTATETRNPGFFTGYPARTSRPANTSNLNASYRRQTIANHAILRASTAGVAVYTQMGSSLVVDVAGYYIGTPSTATLPAPVNIVPPPPPPAGFPYVLSMPRIGRVGTVVEGISSNIVNAGYIGHWPGTSLAGENGHMVMFAHRTTHGGILRYLHTFVPGDEISMSVPDGRVFHYGYARRDITNDSAANIYNVGLAAPLPSVSLVACSKTNTLPTDTRFRLVVTFNLLRVDEP